MAFTILFAGIFGTFILLGWRFRENTHTSGWLYAGKNIPGWLSGLSTAATTIGGSATIVLAHMVYHHGPSGLLIDLPIGIGLLVFGLFFARTLRNSGADTLAHYLELQYGKMVGRISAIFIVLVELTWFGLLIKSFTLFLPSDFFLQGNSAIIAAGLCFLLYIFLSGQRGVFYTDILQAAIMVGGFITLAVVMFTAESTYTPQHVPQSLETAKQLAFFIMMFLSGLTGPDVSSRALYSRNVASARQGLVFGGILKISISLTIGYIAWKSLTVLPALTNSYLLFPTIIDTVFSSPFDALLRIMFLLVMISSADTVLMTAVTTLNRDLFRHALSLNVLKFASLVMGISGILLALYFSDILDMMKTAYTFYAAGPAMLVLYAFLGLRARPWAAALTMTVSGALALLLELSSQELVNPVLAAIGFNIFLFQVMRSFAHRRGIS
ncbi:hypothetical protein LGV61_05700 [Desulfurispirillum indicum]|uniref:sodium:solute symporter family protein n=1 Tax=Desulfurispirillum indicum TaxID=936456 RepID=UPI001CF9C346|nr:hypothetical protein [Desulfurispirillum indicum]UCZ57763.1 hypothetical protein LGV61_05700 [Desulfurispirillum indicum]